MSNTKKLAIISDFHLDINHFSEEELELFNQVLINENITHLHFAGDMSNDFKNLTVPYFKRLSVLTEIAVSYNLGNHDMVGLTEETISANDFQVQWFSDTAFVSFSGWYDYSFMPQPADVKKIERYKHAFYFDRKIHRAASDPLTTEQILSKLKKVLSALTKAKRIIISMHFVPHHAFIIDTRYEKFARFNAYLGSEHFHALFAQFPQITDVVFGHIHHHFSDVVIDDIHYHAKALGYPYEWQMVPRFFELHPELLITDAFHLRKRYNAIQSLTQWQTFRKKELAKEFLSALTVFQFH